MNENVGELIEKIESKVFFDPLDLCFCYESGNMKTRGRYTYKVNRNDIELEFVDFGISGQRNLVSNWVKAVPDENVRFVLFLISLSDVCEDNDHHRRMNEGLRSTKLLNDRSSRNILIFTKPDILMKKLRKGAKYERELDYNIRPELNGIDQYNDKVVINSIVNEYMKRLERTKLDSYHIINTTREDEVKMIMNIIIEQKRQTTFISPCLLPIIIPMQTKLFTICKNELLTDILIMYSSGSV